MNKKWQTRLLHTDARAPSGFESLSTPVFRGSTVVFPNAAAFRIDWDAYRHGYTYGLYGTPTTLNLAARICELEGGYRSVITPGGQAAIALIDLAFLQSGDHMLVPQSIYSPNRRLSDKLLRRFGIDATYYDPLIGEGIGSLIQNNTRLIWCESPGSVTMEIQDVPAICREAHSRGVLVVLDNTWSSGILFDAFAHGVDVTMQALTKYVGGHSDLILGSITVRDPNAWDRVGSAHQLLGYGVSPDECSLALRGLETLAVRLRHIEDSAQLIAQWIAEQREIESVLHPALHSCPGHSIWRRDFSGASGVFSIVFAPEFTKAQVHRFVDALKLFKIGHSWAGSTSIVAPYDLTESRPGTNFQHRIVRLSIGLEDTAYLIDDLQQAFTRAAND